MSVGMLYLFNFFGLGLCHTINLIKVLPRLPTAVEGFPEVIPGPGLPSLTSLGLTSADLYERVPTSDEVSTLEARFDLLCGEVEPPCAVADAVACFNFLNASGKTACTVKGENITFCTAGSCKWVGSNISGGPSASSLCRDVAAGGNAVINTCQDNGLVDGVTAATENRNLIVTISAEP
ncbi:hypothetical protein DFH09DRAFT_1360401 [Mycena vulgaris]|nr:hypothetical protein DFH09DRAFT_1360401 [Mycena vulgaris]